MGLVFNRYIILIVHLDKKPRVEACFITLKQFILRTRKTTNQVWLGEVGFSPTIDRKITSSFRQKMFLL